MTMFFMTHPNHGATLLRSVAEVEAHKKIGWVESTTEQWLAGKSEPIEKTEAIAAPKKRGRPFKAE